MIRETSGNVSLHPIMSDSLGNYESRNLPSQSGPGEGGLFQSESKRKKDNLQISYKFTVLFDLGVPVIVSADEESKAQASISQYGFNMVASDKISMDRRIKDTRPEEYDQVFIFT